MDEYTARRNRLLLRREVLRHRDINHVIPILGTPLGREKARRMYQEVYGRKR
jgi:hypothetical protein